MRHLRLFLSQFTKPYQHQLSHGVTMTYLEEITHEQGHSPTTD